MRPAGGGIQGRVKMLEKINQEIDGMINDMEMQEPISIVGKIRGRYNRYRTGKMEEAERDANLKDLDDAIV